MSFSKSAAIAITGAGNADTGLNVLTAVNLTLSAAGTIEIRETASNGTVVLTETFAAAGNFRPLIPQDGLRCLSGNFFVVNSAGNVAGSVSGLDLAT